jgi:hypothetical protein
LIYERVFRIAEQLAEKNVQLDKENTLLRLALDGYKEKLDTLILQFSIMNSKIDSLEETVNKKIKADKLRKSRRWNRLIVLMSALYKHMGVTPTETLNSELSGLIMNMRSEKAKFQNSMEQSSSEQSTESMNGQNTPSSHTGTS